MTAYRYSSAALNGDLARAGIGFGLCVTPLILVNLQYWVMLLLAGPAAIFAVFGVRTWLRRRCRIAVDERGITMTGFSPAKLSWRDLERYKLSYFSTRRDRSNGWMQLNLRSAHGRLSIDSNLDGFEEVCRRAFEAATENDVELSSATLRNLAELGLVTDLSSNSQPAASTGWGNPADWRR